MKIILVRHLKVDYKWKLFYNSVGYDKACADYDRSDILDSATKINTEFRVITSTMIRCIETSRLLFGKEPDFSDDTICEVPLKSFMTTTMILPKIVWDLMGRIQWRLGVKKQPETYSESIRRVSNFAENLVISDKNCIIVCHGWIIKLMMCKLKIMGFSGNQPLLIRTGAAYEYVR